MTSHDPAAPENLPPEVRERLQVGAFRAFWEHGSDDYLMERDLAINADTTTPMENRRALAGALSEPRHSDGSMMRLAQSSVRAFEAGDHVAAASRMNRYLGMMQTHNDLIRQHLGDSHRWTLAHDKALAIKKKALDEYTDLSMIENPMVKDEFDQIIKNTNLGPQFNPRPNDGETPTEPTNK